MTKGRKKNLPIRFILPTEKVLSSLECLTSEQLAVILAAREFEDLCANLSARVDFNKLGWIFGLLMNLYRGLKLIAFPIWVLFSLFILLPATLSISIPALFLGIEGTIPAIILLTYSATMTLIVLASYKGLGKLILPHVKQEIFRNTLIGITPKNRQLLLSSQLPLVLSDCIEKETAPIKKRILMLCAKETRIQAAILDLSHHSPSEEKNGTIKLLNDKLTQIEQMKKKLACNIVFLQKEETSFRSRCQAMAIRAGLLTDDEQIFEDMDSLDDDLNEELEQARNAIETMEEEFSLRQKVLGEFRKNGREKAAAIKLLDGKTDDEKS